MTSAFHSNSIGNCVFTTNSIQFCAVMESKGHVGCRGEGTDDAICVFLVSCMTCFFS